MQKIFEDLDFISKIQKNEKPNFSDKTLIKMDEWFATLKRRWKSEQGEKGGRRYYSESMGGRQRCAVHRRGGLLRC